MGKAFKVIQTTDAQAFERSFIYYMPSGIAISYQNADYVPVVNETFEKWRTVSLQAVQDAPMSPYTTCIGMAPVFQQQSAAIPCITVESLYVGERFYFADNAYVRIAAITTNQYGLTSVRYDYYKNNSLVGTMYNNDMQPLSGSFYGNCNLLIPYAFKFGIIYSATDIRRYDNQYARFNLEHNNTYGYKISVAGYSGAPSWLVTYFDDFTPVDMDDPYIDIPDSEPSGPAEGSGIPESDPIPAPDLPTVSVLDTGFVGLFNPTLAQVQALADYMWTGLFDINTFKKIFADPMDCILGFNMVPVAVPSGTAVPVRVGNISTGVSMNPATSQWVSVDCGSITVDLPYGCYLDYAPYSKFSLYLPYIGIVELSTDDVVGKTISLKYHVDVLSCSCVAFLTCGTQTLYQWTGSCGYSIPLTGNDFHQVISNIVSIAATIGGAAATGGMSAPLAASAAAAGAATCTNNVMNSKPNIHRSGAIGSSAGMMGIQTPYLIMELPNACKPAKQHHYLGYPGFITVSVNDISGFASFESIILDGIGCTSEERQIIEQYCMEGIYV